MADPNFGTVRGGTVYDPGTLRGWGVREYNWEFSASVQREIVPRVSVDVGYFRRWYGNLTTTDDRALTPADFDEFSIPAPSDPGLPDGGGYVVGGLYDLKPTSFGRPADNYVTFSDAYGRQIEHWNGVDATINARIREGVLLQGGVSTGRTSTDNCELVAKLPELLQPTTPTPTLTNTPTFRSTSHCHVDTKFLTQVKLLGAYTIPRVDVQLSGTFQSIPGPQVLANYVASSALAAQSLGRPLSGGAANATVSIVHPGTMYGERLNQLDLRFAKLLRFGATRTALNVDLYNALNDNAVLQESTTYGNWRQPQGILIGRSVKFSVQFDF